MKILVVCLGNICRSPLAEGILKKKLSSDFKVDSAGTIDLHQGELPDHRAIAIGKNHDVNISDQRSRPITDQDFDEFDLILCMDQSVYQDVSKMAKTDSQRRKISLFMDAAGLGKDENVPDPYWGDMQDFENVYQMLDHASEQLKHKLHTSFANR